MLEIHSSSQRVQKHRTNANDKTNDKIHDKANDKIKKTDVEAQKVQVADTYEQDSVKEKATTYKPDLEKIQKMKEETELRMVELLKGTVAKSVSGQLGGLKGILEKLLSSDLESIDIDIPLNGEDLQSAIDKAKLEVADGGYWSVEETSGRLVDFAMALSGGDRDKFDLLKGAIEDGFKAAEKLWGDKLPEISQKTKEATLEKLEKWKNEI